MTLRAPSDGGTYVYCIGYARELANGSPAFAAPGVGGRGDAVRTVDYADLVAVVSDAPELRVQISRANLGAHQHVLEEAMTHSAVLPVSFGTVASNDQEVREKLLKREFDELHRYLEYVQGRVELGLRVFWNREWLYSEIVAENDEIRGLRDSLAGRPSDTRVYERIHLGQLTEAAVNLKRDHETESILSALQPLAVETRLNGIVTETMILNAAFLVGKGLLQAFDAEVAALGVGQEERLIFRYVGPLPPYSFVSLNVNWED
jgi:hypothetical protein